MDAEDLAPAALVGNADDDLAVEPPGATQRLVERFGPVGRGDDHEVLARLEPVHQGQKLGDQPLFRLAGDLAALGRDRIDLVDEDDGRGGLGRLLENLAQPLFAFAIGRAHDLGPGDVEELGVALIGDRARQPGLAGAGRAMQQHALGRVDPEPLEQLRVAQRQLDHLAQRVDGVVHPAKIVIGDVGPALAVLPLGIFGEKLDLGVGVDVDDPLGGGLAHHQPHFLEREGGRVEQLADMLGHVGIDPLVAGGGDRVAGAERPAGEAALEGLGRAVQPDIVLGRGEHDPGCRLGAGLVNLDMVARADPGIGALQPVEPDDVEPVVLAVGTKGPCRGRALADDLDHVALAQIELLHQLDRQAGNAMATVDRWQVSDLNAPDQSIYRRHRKPFSQICRRAPARFDRNGAGRSRFNLGAKRAKKKAGRCRPAEDQERMPVKARNLSHCTINSASANSQVHHE